jgi:hypothetical protein
MKTPCLTFVVAVSLLATSCDRFSKSKQAAQPTPTPALVRTPHPATKAYEAALRLYPDLAKKDSAFHRTFHGLYVEREATNPASLAAFDWPLDIGRQTSLKLAVMPPPRAIPLTPSKRTPEKKSTPSSKRARKVE